MGVGCGLQDFFQDACIVHAWNFMRLKWSDVQIACNQSCAMSRLHATKVVRHPECMQQEMQVKYSTCIFFVGRPTKLYRKTRNFYKVANKRLSHRPVPSFKSALRSAALWHIYWVKTGSVQLEAKTDKFNSNLS